VENVIEGSRKEPQKVSIKVKSNRVEKNIDVNKIKKDIQETMTRYVGIVRDREGLEKAKKKVDDYYELIKDMKNNSVSDFEMQNIVLVSKLVIEAALERKESRGAHFRLDYQKTDDENWKRNIIKEKFSTY